MTLRTHLAAVAAAAVAAATLAPPAVADVDTAIGDARGGAVDHLRGGDLDPWDDAGPGEPSPPTLDGDGSLLDGFADEDGRLRPDALADQLSSGDHGRLGAALSRRLGDQAPHDTGDLGEDLEARVDDGLDTDLDVGDDGAPAAASLSQRLGGFVDPDGRVRDDAASVLSGASIDAIVARRGAEWATSLGDLRAGRLDSPAAPDAAGLDRDLPAQSLAFGILVEGAVADMLDTHPEVLDQVGGGALGDDHHRDAWANSLANAHTQVSRDLPELTADPCMSGMLSAAVSGDPGDVDPDCGPCGAAGVYLNRELEHALFDRDLGARLLGENEDEGFLPPRDLERLPQWQQDAIRDQNPHLDDGDTAGAGLLHGCGVDGDHTGPALESTLPEVFDQLEPRTP